MAATTLGKVKKDIAKLESKKAGLEEKKQVLVNQIAEIDKEIQALRSQEAALKIKNVEKAALKNGKTVDEVLDFLSANLTDVLELMGDSNTEDVSQETSSEDEVVSEEQEKKAEEDLEPSEEEEESETDEDTEETTSSSVWDR